MSCLPNAEDVKTWAWWKKKLLKHFLPIGFVVSLIIGLSWPWLGDTVSSWKVQGYRVIPTIHLCTIFVVSGLTLNTKEAVEALKAPKGLIYGLASILGITPLLGFVMLKIPFSEEAFSTGLAIFCTVPTTLSSGVALVTSAYGNSALALLLCVGSNTIGIFTVPYLLQGILSSTAGINLDAVALLIQLVITILVPLFIGKALLELVPAVQRFVKKHKNFMKLLNNGSLVSIVWQSISRAQDDITGTPFEQICLLILAGVAIHVVYLAINISAAKLLNLSLRDYKAVIFMASQKTLPIAVAVISFLPTADFGSQGLLTIPCIIGHLSQLFMDAFIASRMAAAEEDRQDKKKEAVGNEQDSDTNAGDEGVIPVATAGAKREQGSVVVRREASLDTNPVAIPMISKNCEDSAHEDNELQYFFLVVTGARWFLGAVLYWYCVMNQRCDKVHKAEAKSSSVVGSIPTGVAEV